MSIGTPQCLSCKHKHARGEGPVARPSCAAFPQGIPREILKGGFDHRAEYPGDGGIRYEPKGQPKDGG